MEKSTIDCQFGFRVDIDTVRGFVGGVPRLLATFDRLGIKVTFALTTGPDRSLFNAVNFFPPFAKLLGINRKINGENTWKAKFPDFSSTGINLIYMSKGNITNPFARDLFIKAEKQYGVVKTLLARGHEIILHGYDHFTWANHLENMSLINQSDLLVRGILEFKEITGRSPKGFAAPAFNTTPRIIEVLKELKFDYCSNHVSSHISKIKTLSVENDSYLDIPVYPKPVLEVSKEINDMWDVKGINRLKKCNHDHAVFFYLHAGVEGFQKDSIMIKIINKINRKFSGRNVRMIDYARQLK